ISLYAPLLRRWAQCEAGNAADRDDLVQEVLLELYRRLPSFEYDGSGRFRGWLRTQFTYVRLNWARKAGRELLLGEQTPERAAPPEQDEAEEREYRHSLLRRARELIRPEFTEVTWRAFEAQVGGRKAADVAAELGISRAAAYVAKSRVLARLRQELEGLL